MSERRDIDALVGRLGLEEKTTLLAGADLWTTVALPEHGIPPVTLCDGPNGARGPALPEGFGGDPTPSYCFPCGAALGATWDVEIVEAVGKAIGAEARTKASRILLAPTVNLHRSLLGGRNFESFAEDPILAGCLAAAYVRGAQANGVACTVKHFAGNESEKVRFLADSVVDERTLREVHLVPFELAVREGGALGIMTAYNRVNGTYSSGHRTLLRDILRGEWGFEGLVVSDWFSVVDTVDAIEAGLDLEMPGPGRAYGDALATAVREGRVDESLVDAAAARLLRVLDRIGALDDAPAAPAVDGRDEHRSVSRAAAAASMVLLENHGVLPLDVAQVRRVALIGPHAAGLRIMGGGSASLSVADAPRSPVDVLRSRMPHAETIVESGVDIALHTPTISPDQLVAPDGTPGMEIVLFDVDDLGGAPRATLHPTDGAFVAFGPAALECPGPYAAIGRCTLQVPESGRYVLSLTQTGRATVAIEGERVLDLHRDELPGGHDFMGHGHREQHAIVELVAGRAYELRVEMRQEERLLSHGFRLGLRPAAPADALERAVEAARGADTVIVVVGATDDHDSEQFDRRSITLPAAQDELVARVLAVAPHAIVVVNTGSIVTMPWAAHAGAVLQVWLGGNEMAEALVDVLTGDREPGGRLPTTIPLRLEHSPAFGNDDAEDDRVRYTERVLVGHRWYDMRGIDVAYPFGAGRGYTTFTVEAPEISRDQLDGDRPVDVSFTVANTGTRRGSEIVQVYVAPPAGPVLRAPRELKRFVKVTLDPGEQRRLTVTLAPRAFAHWQPDDAELDRLTERIRRHLPWTPVPDARAHRGWVVRRGEHRVLIGRDSRTFDHQLAIHAAATFAIDDVG